MQVKNAEKLHAEREEKRRLAAALAERNRLRKKEEAELLRTAANTAADKMRLRREKLLRLDNPNGQYSAAVAYINRERFADKPEVPEKEGNLSVLTRQGQGVGVQYHVRYQGHAKWLSREGLAAAAAEAGGLTDAERALGKLHWQSPPQFDLQGTF